VWRFAVILYFVQIHGWMCQEEDGPPGGVVTTSSRRFWLTGPRVSRVKTSARCCV